MDFEEEIQTQEPFEFEEYKHQDPEESFKLPGAFIQDRETRQNPQDFISPKASTSQTTLQGNRDQESQKISKIPTSVQQSTKEENSQIDFPENQSENTKVPKLRNKRTKTKLSLKKLRKSIWRENHKALKNRWKSINKDYPIPSEKPELYTEIKTLLEETSEINWENQDTDFKSKFYILCAEKVYLTKDKGRYYKGVLIPENTEPVEYISHIFPSPLNWSNPYLTIDELEDKVGLLDLDRLRDLLYLFCQERTTLDTKTQLQSTVTAVRCAVAK